MIDTDSSHGVTVTGIVEVLRGERRRVKAPLPPAVATDALLITDWRGLTTLDRITDGESAARNRDDRPEEGVPTTVASEPSIGYRESLITTFVECPTSSCSRPMVTSQPSR